MTSHTLPLSCLIAFTGCLVASAQSAPLSPSVASTAQRCPADTHESNEGETALARKDFKAAAEFYRSAVAHDAKSDEAHLGLTRALIGQDDTAAALAEANAMLAQNPSSILGEVALGESLYRAANFDAAYEHFRKGLKNDPCEGRLYAGVANIASNNALFGRAAQLLFIAHSYRPNDELIRRDWIDSLPRSQRLIELTRYLAGQHAFSEVDKLAFTNEVEHLKARRPGECRVSSKTENVRVPFQPITGDSAPTHPVAYGLDVLFNGKRRRMQIDSGASGIVLTKAAAKALNLVPEFHSKTAGIGDDGDVGSYITHVASIRIGDVEVADCMVEVLDKSKLDGDGLIGVDVFDRWLVTLDYQNAQLMLAPLPARPGTHPAHTLNTLASGAPEGDDSDQPPMDRYLAPEMKDWFQIIRIGHNLLLPALIGNGPSHYLIADTGASQSVLSLFAAREAGKVHEDYGVDFRGVSGKVKRVFHIDNTKLQFGLFQVPPTSYFAFDLTNISHDVGAEISGFVGLPTLSRLTISIDYRDNLVKMTYDPKHDIRRF